MYRLLVVAGFLTGLFFTAASGQNPYQAIGKTAVVLTLSEGKYNEAMANDSIVLIGTALFNRFTNEIIGFAASDSAAMAPAEDRARRFLSLDPIARKYPQLTPYQFASNTPIQAIDLDGLEQLHFLMDQAQKYKGFDLVLKIINGTGITTEIMKAFAENNTETDMYYTVEKFTSPSLKGETKLYSGFKSIRVTISNEDKAKNQNKQYSNMVGEQPNLTEGDISFIWKTTFSNGKGAILENLSQDAIEQAGGDLNKLAEITLTAVHEAWAHGINHKLGSDFNTDLEEHAAFFGETYRKSAGKDGYYSPKYKDIDPKSVAGKFKNRIERYIKEHKEELMKLIKNEKNEAPKN